MNAIVYPLHAEAPPPRMAPLARLPLFFALKDRRAVVAGGSAAAAWKAELLSAAGAAVNVYAADPCEELLALSYEPPGGPIQLIRRDWEARDLSGAALAIGGFAEDATAADFAAAARSAGVPVNVIDKPAFCDFSFGSIVNRSPLVVGISTDGAAPMFAQAIRARIEALLPHGFANWVAVAVRWRPTVKSSGLSFAGRRKLWQIFTARAFADPHRGPDETDLAGLVAEVGLLADRIESGSVAFVDAGPGEPDLMTLGAVRALQASDDILFDDDLSHAILDFARREARKIEVGSDSEIAGRMIELARSGRRVVRLTAGACAAAVVSNEAAACRAAGIAVETIGPSR